MVLPRFTWRNSVWKISLQWACCRTCNGLERVAHSVVHVGTNCAACWLRHFFRLSPLDPIWWSHRCATMKGLRPRKMPAFLSPAGFTYPDSSVCADPFGNLVKAWVQAAPLATYQQQNVQSIGVGGMRNSKHEQNHYKIYYVLNGQGFL